MFSWMRPNHFATMRMMRKEGSTTPRVAQTAPATPDWDMPTKVAMLTAKGPGVDSLMAMKSMSCCWVSQPCERMSCWIIGIIA